MEGSEIWIRFAMHALQEGNAVQMLDVELFMSFAHGYLRRRLEGEGPARIEYSRAKKDHSVKSRESGFWISYPQTESKYDTHDPYGGLM